MGAGDASAHDVRLAEELGRLIATESWILLTGGRPGGVMDAASRGAHSVEGSLVLGILPSERGGVSAHVDVAVFTGMGNARNVINVLTSSVVVVCGEGGAGTASEAALALKAGKPLVLLAPSSEAAAFFRSLDGNVHVAHEPREAIEIVRTLIA